MRKIIQQGETLRLYVGYNDIETGAPLDPVSLSVLVVRPDKTTQTITYPHIDIVKIVVGDYFIRILGTQVGTWRYKINAQLNVNDIDVRDGKFDVEPSP